jgi:hypothetical protein
MQAAPPIPVQAFAPDLARRFGLIIACLVALVSRRLLREPRLALLIVPLCTRLRRAARRFERLMVGLAAGRLPLPHPSGAPTSASPGAPTSASPGAPTSASPGPGGPHRSVLPTGRGWLIRVLGYEAAGYASQLQALLAEPAAARLLAAAPTAGRILRPLSRMLAIGAFTFRSRPARAAPAPAAEPPWKVAFRSPGCTWYEVPTPPTPGPGALPLLRCSI